MRSSYIENHYDEVIKAYVVNWRPVTLVELGVLDGYSTVAIAEGCKENKLLYDMTTKVISYDLFEDYEFKHGNMQEVQKLIDDKKLQDFVELRKGGAYKVHSDFADKSIQFMHVDISNTGDTLRNIVDLWTPKMDDRAIVLFEGGSEERDNNEWMKKYNKPSIKKELETSQFITDHYIYGTYWAYPSMTVLLRKWY